MRGEAETAEAERRENMNAGSLDALVRTLKAKCNRHVNGSCHTLACMKRGGYKRGDRVDYGSATCEQHEQAMALETLLAKAKLSHDT